MHKTDKNFCTCPTKSVQLRRTNTNDVEECRSTERHEIPKIEPSQLCEPDCNLQGLLPGPNTVKYRKIIPDGRHEPKKYNLNQHLGYYRPAVKNSN